jgi:hypothetical protein
MILIVSNPHRIIDSAFYKHTNLAFSVHINTVKKWVKPSCVASTCDSRSWYYEDDVDEIDHVTLIAQTTEDKEILNRIEFHQYCKDQIWILLPKACVYLE